MYSAGDIIRITMKGTYLTQQVVNVYFFLIDSITAPDVSLFDVLDDFVTDFDDSVMGTLSSELTYSSVIVDNLTDGVSFDEYSFSIAGVQPGEPLASFYALGVKLSRSTKATRNGAKRYAGLPENLVDGNQHSVAAGDITDIQSFLGTPRTYADYDGAGSTIVLRPVIVGRTLNVDGVYELDLSKINQISGAIVNPNVTTQNSRKV